MANCGGRGVHIVSCLMVSKIKINVLQCSTENYNAITYQAQLIMASCLFSGNILEITAPTKEVRGIAPMITRISQANLSGKASLFLVLGDDRSPPTPSKSERLFQNCHLLPFSPTARVTAVGLVEATSFVKRFSSSRDFEICFSSRETLSLIAR